MSKKKLKDAKLASNEKQKIKYKVTLMVESYLKSNGAWGLRKYWIKELI